MCICIGRSSETRVKSEMTENTTHNRGRTHTHEHPDFGGNNNKQTKRNRMKTMCTHFALPLFLFLFLLLWLLRFCFVLFSFSKIKAHYFLSLIDINLVVRCVLLLCVNLNQVELGLCVRVYMCVCVYGKRDRNCTNERVIKWIADWRWNERNEWVCGKSLMEYEVFFGNKFVVCVCVCVFLFYSW